MTVIEVWSGNKFSWSKRKKKEPSL